MTGVVFYSEFILKYPNHSIGEDTWNLLYADAIVETSSINFGVLLPKAVELLILHYAEINEAWTTTEVANVGTLKENVKSFQINQEGYAIAYKDSPINATKWGLEYQRLLSQALTMSKSISIGSSVAKRGIADVNGYYRFAQARPRLPWT